MRYQGRGGTPGRSRAPRLPTKTPAARGCSPAGGRTLQAHRKLFVALLLLFATPIPAPGQGPGSPELRSGPSYVSGMVLDHTTGEPLQGAEVALREVEGSRVATRTTTEQGLFRFDAIRASLYEIWITHAGYKEVQLRLDPRDGDDVRVEVEMVRTVVTLEPLVVTATRQTLLRRVGFLDRREVGLGQFMTRDQIEARNPFRVSDMFRTMAGFRVVPGARSGGDRVLGRGNCPPAIFVDGTRLLEGSSIDEVLRPESLEALEVYHASQTPARFRGSRCGAVVAWTRSPDPGERGQPLTWRRILFGLGFIGLAITATSL